MLHTCAVFVTSVQKWFLVYAWYTPHVKNKSIFDSTKHAKPNTAMHFQDNSKSTTGRSADRQVGSEISRLLKLKLD